MLAIFPGWKATAGRYHLLMFRPLLTTANAIKENKSAKNVSTAGGDALDEFGDLRNKRICVGVRVPEHHVTPRGQHHSLVLNTCRRVGACRCVRFKAVCSEQ